jgi:hypothetical protein
MIAASKTALPLRRVLLSTGGVGYFEHAATVTGDASLPLEARLDQIDDVLKSLVVFDAGGSSAGATLPARSPLRELFRDLPFDEPALGSAPALLGALRGAEVSISVAGGSVSGRLLSVTKETSGTTSRHRVAVAAAGAVKEVILEDAERVELTDPTLQQQLDGALAALAEHREKGLRTLQIESRGQGDHVVRVGYVVAAPLWKATYRLVLPADPQAPRATLQGFAVVENQSGANWDDVDMTLVAGSPVTFRQALYPTYFVARPEVPVEVVGHVLPPPDQPVGAPPRAPAHAKGGFGAGGLGGDSRAEASPPPIAAVPEAEVAEVDTQIVFHLPARVTLAAQEDALLPVLARDLPFARVSIYRPDVDAARALTAVEIQNDGDTGLPPGVVTTYERTASGEITYAGDARLAHLPAGERRLLGYGVDLELRVDRQITTSQALTVATLVDGVLTLTRSQRLTSRITLTGAPRAARTVILEEPRVPGYRLTSPSEGVESTATHYRVRVEVPAGATVTVTVTQEQPVEERIVLGSLGAGDLEAYADAAELPEGIRQALGRAAVLRADVDAKAKALSTIDEDLAAIAREQERLRENLKVVPAGTPLAQRYLGMLSAEEDRIARLSADREEARKALEAARRALAEALRTLD